MLGWVTRSPVRMLVLIAVLVGLPMMILGQNLTNSAQKASRDVELARVGDGAAVAAEVVANKVTALVEQTRSIADNDEVRAPLADGDHGLLASELIQFVERYGKDVRRLFVLDVSGRFVASAPTQWHVLGDDLSRSDYFLGAANPWRTFVSPTYMNESLQSLDETIAVPIYDASGVPIGLLCAVVDLSQAGEWLGTVTVLYDEIYVVDARGRLVFGEGVAGLAHLRDLSSDPTVALALTGRVVTTESDDLFSGARRFVGSASVTGLGWIVFAANSPVPSAERLTQLTDGLLVLRLILLGLLLVGGVLFAQTALRAQKIAFADLTRLNRAKSDFVSVVSHEFRTPLTGIQGFSEMIRDDPLSMEDIKEFANDINNDATRLSRMISEMLDLDRMESGKTESNRERVDLAEAARVTADRMGANAPRHPVTLEVEPNVPLIWAERDRITQVVTNLISNAIKYSPDGGGVTVGVDTSGGMAHFWVRDHGIGIAPDSLEAVFDRYSRLATVKTRSIQGTGLGLPIVREICKAHGGRAWAESILGSGSTFHVSLPFDQRAAA
jgi:signal transduction histidine kinase